MAKHLPTELSFLVMTLSINSTMLTELEGALTDLSIRDGFELLDSALNTPARFRYPNPDAISLLLCLAQWIDIGYRNLDALNDLYAPLASLDIGQLSFLEFLQLRMIEGFCNLATENHTGAISVLGAALSVGEATMWPHLKFVAHFWKSRAHRRAGEYEAASSHLAAAKEIIQAVDAPKLLAIVKIHESWLLFQRGDRRHALRLLDEAEAELKPIGHALFLGNIESARGRFVRRAGEYAKALQHFENAIEMYSVSYALHPNCARALVNAAYVKRLIALDMQAGGGGQATGSNHARYLLLIDEALELLERARKIYAADHHQSGTGAVLVNVGHLHLEGGDIDRASLEAGKAYDLGSDKRDQILMARARILQSAVELARAEEQMGDDPDVALHAALAAEYGQEAIELATHTQNRRLLAEAYIVRATAAADDTYQDWELAKKCVSQASDLLSHEDRDHLAGEIKRLKARILRSTGIEHSLRQWSDGQNGNKTFQQIQEEFAEIFIPKVWINNGKNITKVAKVLSVSPKKIRRILRNCGYREV